MMLHFYFKFLEFLLIYLIHLLVHLSYFFFFCNLSLFLCVSLCWKWYFLHSSKTSFKLSQLCFFFFFALFESSNRCIFLLIIDSEISFVTLFTSSIILSIPWIEEKRLLNQWLYKFNNSCDIFSCFVWSSG